MGVPRPTLPRNWQDWNLFGTYEWYLQTDNPKEDANPTWTETKAARVVRRLNNALLEKAAEFEQLYHQLGELDETIDSDDIHDVTSSVYDITDGYESGVDDSEPANVVRDWLGEFVTTLNSM